MLTEEALNYILRKKHQWITGFDSGSLSTIRNHTNCGTLEISNIHQSSFEVLSKKIGECSIDAGNGHYLYTLPLDQGYNAAIPILKRIGFTMLSEFYNTNYRHRKNKGLSQLWNLVIPWEQTDAIRNMTKVESQKLDESFQKEVA